MNYLQLIVVITALDQATINTVTAYSISYKDCNSPSQVRTFDVDSLCSPNPENDEIKEAHTFTILQKPTTRRTTGYSCSVRRSVWYFKCGVWSHLKLGSVPKISHPMDLTVAQCQSMATTRHYYYPGNSQPFTLELNKEIYLEMVTTGELTEKENAITCKGETLHVGNTLHRNVLVLEELKFLIKTQEYIVSDDVMEVIDDHVKLPCKYPSLGCTTGQATYIWTQFPQTCGLEIIRNISPSRTMGSYLVDHNHQFLINTTGTTTLPSCPMMLTRTDHPSIFLAATSDVISLPTVNPNTIDISLQAHIHLNYMSYQLEREMARQDESIMSHACKTTQLRDNPTPFKLTNEQLLK